MSEGVIPARRACDSSAFCSLPSQCLLFPANHRPPLTERTFIPLWSPYLCVIPLVRLLSTIHNRMTPPLPPQPNLLHQPTPSHPASLRRTCPASLRRAVYLHHTDCLPLYITVIYNQLIHLFDCFTSH